MQTIWKKKALIQYATELELSDFYQSITYEVDLRMHSYCHALLRNET